MEESSAIESFLKITSKKSLAIYLGVKYKSLAYQLYKLTDSDKYVEFEIGKRSGGKRHIIAPNSGIKFIQKNLANILLQIYPEKKCVHGYSKDKSIKTNACVHVNRKHVLNIDLNDFFPSINFGRVRGMFKSHPFNFNDEVATALAQICCYKGRLPQGAPTSPIISNFICRRLDNQLLMLSKSLKVTYSRYADDITFSTNILPIPAQIGTIINNNYLLSQDIINIVESNGFSINENKTRFATKKHRQEVTGLVVNKFVNVKRTYVRHVRAMLNAWEKYGISEAAVEHFGKYNYKNKSSQYIELAFQNELVGKIGYIGMIRGKDDFIYKKLYQRIKVLNPDVKLSVIQKESELIDLPIIFGEGKTDWKHLKAALDYFHLNGKYLDINFTFKMYEDGMQMNNSELLKICQSTPKTNLHKNKILCVFDRDTNEINKSVCDGNLNYKNWGNNVYSILLPIPKHRVFEKICIEHYYNDDEIKICNEKGYRLFLSNEFNKDTGKHETDDLIYVNRNYLNADYPRIIDDKVFSGDGVNKALSKKAFADLILNKNPAFAKIQFEHFADIFDLLQIIMKT